MVCMFSLAFPGEVRLESFQAATGSRRGDHMLANFRVDSTGRLEPLGNDPESALVARLAGYSVARCPDHDGGVVRLSESIETLGPLVEERRPGAAPYGARPEEMGLSREQLAALTRAAGPFRLDGADVIAIPLVEYARQGIPLPRDYAETCATWRTRL